MSTVNDPPIRLLARFEQVFPSKTPQVVVQAPDRELWAAASFNGTANYTVCTTGSDTRATFTYQSARRKETIYRRPLPRWVRYIAGVTALIDVPEMPGIEVVVCADETAGPRYEYGLGILFAALWYEINLEIYTADQLQELAERVRREYVEG